MVLGAVTFFSFPNYTYSLPISPEIPPAVATSIVFIAERSWEQTIGDTVPVLSSSS